MLAHTRLLVNGTYVKSALTVAFAPHPDFMHSVLTIGTWHEKLTIAHFRSAVWAGTVGAGTRTRNKPVTLVTTKDAHAAQSSSLGLGLGLGNLLGIRRDTKAIHRLLFGNLH